MTYQIRGADALDYYPCRYAGSRVLFRGPRRRMDKAYVAFLGGTETYGRFVERPFPEMLERRLALECVNFGAVNAGVDLYLNDPGILRLAAGAQAKVVQVTGAQNLSNRFYRVHPRRNDRFLRASERLEALFPEVDFTEFHFTRHMLTRLADISEDRLAEVVEELRRAWTARMKQLVALLRGQVVLFYLADTPPGADGAGLSDARAPLFVSASMLDVLRPRVAKVIVVTISEAARVDGTVGKVFTERDAVAARDVPGPRAHAEAADALAPVLHDLTGRNTP